jgi:hypothetical protein
MPDDRRQHASGLYFEEQPRAELRPANPTPPPDPNDYVATLRALQDEAAARRSPWTVQPIELGTRPASPPPQTPRQLIPVGAAITEDATRDAYVVDFRPNGPTMTISREEVEAGMRAYLDSVGIFQAMHSFRTLLDYYGQNVSPQYSGSAQALRAMTEVRYQPPPPARDQLREIYRDDISTRIPTFNVGTRRRAPRRGFFGQEPREYGHEGDQFIFDFNIPIPRPEPEESRPQYATRLMEWVLRTEEGLKAMLRPLPHGARVENRRLTAGACPEGYGPRDRAEWWPANPTAECIYRLTIVVPGPVPEDVLAKMDAVPRTPPVHVEGWGGRLSIRVKPGVFPARPPPPPPPDEGDDEDEDDIY